MGNGTNRPFSDLFAEIHSQRQAYYDTWTHGQTFTLTRARDDELRRAAQLLYRCCLHYAGCYERFLHLIPYDEAVLETLEYCRRYPFRAGTYRPDFLIDEAGDFKICEITSRFFGNGYFLSHFYSEHARRDCLTAGVDDMVDYLEGLLEYFSLMAGGKKRLVVLKSSDKSDSIPLYVPFYEALGLEAVVVESHEVESRLGLLEDAFVVSALNQVDLQALGRGTRRLLADVGCRNDLRTVYLLHDKRFLRLVFEDSFTSEVLTPDETAFLRARVVPTYLPGVDGEAFARARENKDSYIVKHRCLGKSEQVYAGRFCSPGKWKALFSPESIGDMILQPFLRTRTFAVERDGETFEEFVCGTMLTVDDRYFGPGLFRSSSFPVINQGDDFKFGMAVTDQAAKLPMRFLI